MTWQITKPADRPCMLEVCPLEPHGPGPVLPATSIESALMLIPCGAPVVLTIEARGALPAREGRAA